jgi:hypothetical protein
MEELDWNYVYSMKKSTYTGNKYDLLQRRLTAPRRVIDGARALARTHRIRVPSVRRVLDQA